MKLAIFFAAILLIGCATPAKINLFKDVPQSEIDQDNAACHLEAMKIQTASYEYRGTFMEGASINNNQNNAFILCMKSKGYYDRS